MDGKSIQFSKYRVVIDIIVIIICAVILYKVLDKPAKIIRDESLKIKVDSLNTEIKTLKEERDILRQSIDSSEAQVILIEKWYEKEYNTIITQPVDSDFLFFSKYLSKEFK